MKKKAPGPVSHTVSRQDMELINRLAKKELAPEEVYTFSVRLCDNEIDRDFERFHREALEGLAPLFIGRSGIFDHNWSAKGQTARLYRAEVVEEDGLTQCGDPACYLKGYAYMLRSEKNQELIDEIEAGIKREVSIGCSVSRRTCSICGKENCSHQPGKLYGDKLCYMTLSQPTDAYEWSFVAVPAQRKAGVIKSYPGRSLKKALENEPQYLAQLEALEKEAALGRSYMAGLRKDVVRLAGLAEEELDLSLFSLMADRLDETELLELRRVWQKRLDSAHPLTHQLRPGDTQLSSEEDGAFLI